MIPQFQPAQTEQTKVLKARIEDAFAMIIQGTTEGDFTRLYDAVEDMRMREPRLHNSMRACYLTRAIFDLVSAEDKYRRNRSVDERPGAA